MPEFSEKIDKDFFGFLVKQKKEKHAEQPDYSCQNTDSALLSRRFKAFASCGHKIKTISAHELFAQ